MNEYISFSSFTNCWFWRKKKKRIGLNCFFFRSQCEQVLCVCISNQRCCWWSSLSTLTDWKYRASIDKHFVFAHFFFFHRVSCSTMFDPPSFIVFLHHCRISLGEFSSVTLTLSIKKIKNKTKWNEKKRQRI